LDKDKTGILNKKVLEQMTNKRLPILYNLNWDEIIEECDQNGNNGIDYQEFISACIDRKVLLNQEDVLKAFRMLDYNNDGVISLDDFENLFNSYGGARMNNKIWSNLLMEADQNGDGTVSF
jgi:calcium-dependent protein kinase